MSMFKRIMSVLMALLLLVGLFPQVPLQIRASETLVSTEGTESTETETTEATEPAESVPEEPATMITRVQWIQALVESFEYTLSADAMPDNYFADITGEEEYYDAIMTAVYHGLVDSLPGTEFRPDDPATREFAAQTLNSCMGYLPSEETYSYSEYETVTYPDDIQVAVEEGWFALVDGAFLPEQAITSAEVENLVAVAREFVNGMIIEEGHENQYTFKEGVIEITDAAEIEVSEDRTTAMISIQDCTATVVSGDTFVVYTNGLAAPYQALEVAQIDGTTVISAICLQFGDAIETMDVQMSMDTDPTNYYTAEDAELVFIEETTGEEYASAEAALFAMRTNEFAVVIPKFTKTLDLGGGMTVSISVELKSTKICVDSNIGWSKKSCSVWLDTNADITAKVSCDLGEMVDSPIEVYVGGYNVSGVGGLSFYLKVDITGAVTVVQKYHLKCGITLGYNSDKDKPIKKMIFKVREKGSSINAEVTAKLYLEAKFGLYGEVLPVRGYLYGEIGFKATLRYTTYEGIEGDCTHFAAYLYAEYGAKVEWGYGPWSNELDWNREPINEDNSPIKIGAHYEDGVEVAACTRTGMSGTSVGESSKIADSGYVTTQESSYSGSGMLSGSSSTGHTSSGEPVTVYSYTLDDDDNATITGYYGNVSSLTIPMTLDGYDVVAIGNNAFNGHTELRTVIIQDNITSIGTSAFEGCSNLRTVTLSDSLTQIAEKTFQYCSKLTTIDIPDLVISVGNYAFAYCTNLQNVNLSSNLQTLGNSAFAGCTKLASIWIPKTLTSAGYENWGYTYSGAFNGCSALKTVTFEEGITEIPKFLFVYCSGLESITIPDSVTVIEERAFCWAQNLKEVNFGSGLVEIQSGAFADCTGLETITLPDALVTIGTLAFNNCTNLATVEFSDSINTIGDKAFENCTSLTSLVLPKQLTTMGNSAFGNCTSITEVWIPKTLTSAGYENWGYTYSGAFNSCSTLKTVTFEEGITEIPKFLFVYCSGLESITIPDSVTVIEERAFCWAQNLKEVNFGSGLVEIQSGAFADCTGLETITLPDALVTIGTLAFNNCTNLATVEFSDSINTIGDKAFENCTSLTILVLPKQLTTMGNSAFGNCTSITEVWIPKTLTSAGYENYGYTYSGAFNSCSALKTVTFEEGMTEIPKFLFIYCSGLESITIPDSVTVIEERAFSYAQNLKEVNFGNGLVEIQKGAFANCAALETMVISDSVTTMGERVFECSTALRSVTWSAGMKSVPGYTFDQCTALAEVVLTESVTTIGDNAFSNCDSLIELTLPDSVTTMGKYVFNDCDALTGIHLSESLTSISQYAFYDCDALENVTMASKLTTMGDYAFYHCDALKNVKLSLRLTSIPSYAFYGCGSLEEIVIPYYTISISGNAFNSCPKLAKVVTHGNLASIESSAFSYPNLTVFYGTAGSYTQTWAEENGYTFNENTSTATAVALGENQITLAKGATYTLALNIDPTDFSEAITFKSNKTSVVTVDEKGVLTAVGVGTATVKIIVGDASVSCKVTVTQAVTKIKLDKTILSLDVPETYRLTATITPTDASNQILVWASSDDSVATVDENGLVTAVGNGTVTITATATDGSGISASCTVTVTDPNNIPVSSIALNQTDATMQALEIIQLIATVGPENAANKTLSWSSSDESVAIVDQNGVVTAIAKGTAVITATATDDSGVSASCTVVVTNTAYIVDNIEDLQSSHNYENNCKDFWVYTVNGAVNLDVTFDEQTEIEDGFDYLHIYDGEGNLIGTYTGTELAGQTVNVSGSTIRIMIETDDSGTEWGFKVVSVEPTFENREYEILEGANSTWTDNGTEEVAVRVDSEIEDFIEVRLNGELVAPENYTVIEGSTIVTFKPEFLATLKPGEYALSIVFVDGQADTTLTIVEEHVHEFVDGVCTGCGKEVSTGTINKRSAILELENMVRIVLKMTSYTGFEGIDLTENMGLLVWSEDAELTDETATFENAEQVVEGGFLLDGVYCVKTEGIAAKELGDDLQMRIYVRLEDGSYVYDKLVSYSALKYARSTIQKSSNEELVALCKAMLNYGAAAQIAFNYKTESLMNAELSEEDKVLNWDASILDAVEAVDANKVVGLDRNKTVFTNRGAVLALEGAVNIQFRMGIASEYAETAQEIGILYWSADTYQTVDVLTAENADLTDTMVYSESVGRYVSEYPGIAPKDLGDTVYACAYLVAEDGTYYHSGVVAYSVEKYIENTIKDSSTAAEETKTLVKWLGIYGELAKEYFY